MDKGIEEKDSSQLREEIQDTEDIIKPENSPTHPLEASPPSPPSPQFECYYCRQCLPSQSELIAHMDKESADAKERLGK
ncbi:MAG: hypothetical protein WBZ36_12285 [Candidatus Nitrosopolaris sp.]